MFLLYDFFQFIRLLLCEENFSTKWQELDTHSSIMAKRFLKQPTPAESEGAGCLSGFISIFDFRVGHYSQKLLADRKRGVSRDLGKKSFLLKKIVILIVTFEVLIFLARPCMDFIFKGLIWQQSFSNGGFIKVCTHTNPSF